MKKKIVLLTLVSVLLLSAMVITLVSPQERIVGVNVDDWFKYGDIYFNWSSNDPNATLSPELLVLNETEWLLVSIKDVSGTNITIQTVEHFINGSEMTYDGYIDIDTGTYENVTVGFVSAGLSQGDSLYTAEYSEWMINETIIRTYPDSTRETNHMNITDLWSQNGAEYYYSTNVYWDKSTGVAVESSFEFIKQNGSYLSMYSRSVRLIESNVWVVPEFPTWTSMLLILVVLTFATVIYKRRLLQPRIH